MLSIDTSQIADQRLSSNDNLNLLMVDFCSCGGIDCRFELAVACRSELIRHRYISLTYSEGYNEHCSDEP